MSSKFDYLVVGSGLTGSVLARHLAEDGKRVLVIDRRKQLGGNVYDEKDEAGVLVQRFGVHVFHTDSSEVFNYLSRFTEWVPFSITCLVSIDGKMTDVPFNFSCIDTFWEKEDAEKLKADLLASFPGRDRVPVIELLHSDNESIRKFGEFLFENDYRPYTCKQWGRKPDEIDVSILNRVQVCLSYDNRYFADKYQFMPKDGFTAMMKRMLDHPGIELRLGIDLKDVSSLGEHAVRLNPDFDADRIIYTGALDYLFDYKYGPLPYRTLNWEYKTYDVDKYLPAPFVSYPLHPTLSRAIEFKSITGQIIKGKTTVLYEYPLEYSCQDKGHDPLYPIISDANKTRFMAYREEAKKFSNLIVAGRLADYKYYDMDDAIARAFEIYREIK